MATALREVSQPVSAVIERVLIAGDLAPLTTEQRVEYYKRVCESLGLNPLTKPFEYIALNGKLRLYPTRDCTDQLRRVHGVSVSLTDRKVIEGVCIVQARARDKTGREDEATGAVNIAGLRGETLANAIMKAETKAKRRVTLSICGLGMMDESEAEDLPENAKREPIDVTPKAPLGMPEATMGPNGTAPAQKEPERPPITVHPHPKEGATARAWQVYARTMAELASEAPDFEWLLDFEKDNAEGLGALEAASEKTFAWLQDHFGRIAKSFAEPAEAESA